MSIQINAKARLIEAASPEEKELKQKIALRKTYEALQESVSKAKHAYRDTKGPSAKFKAWKEANPGYPTEKLEVLQKRLQSIGEKADPSKKADRNAGEAKSADLVKQRDALANRIKGLEEDLADLAPGKGGLDYTPDDVGDVGEYKANLKTQLAKAKADLKKLSNQITTK